MSSFFKKHKRNSSLTNQLSNSSSGSKDMGLSLNEKSASIKNKNNINNSNNSHVILNSYKKSQNMFSNLDNPNDCYGVNSIDNNSKKLSSSPNLKSTLNNKMNNNNNYNPFNLCPKLDEVPLIEPLICKRIATERLTSLVFREDCLIVSSLDGVVYTWSRPSQVM
jgi:hypothetical protein